MDPKDVKSGSCWNDEIREAVRTLRQWKLSLAQIAEEIELQDRTEPLPEDEE